MNRVILIGRLTRDPELRYTRGNTAIAMFNLAVDRRVKDDGTKETDFIVCKCFNKLAENLVKFQKRGNLISLVGRIRTDSYDDKDGKRKYTIEVVADEIQFLSQKQKQEEPSNELTSNEENQYSQLSAKTVMNENYNPELAITDDLLPF